jgi:hypothetical protein
MDGALRVNRHLPLAQPKAQKEGNNLFPRLPTASELRWNLWELPVMKFVAMWEFCWSLWELISRWDKRVRCAESLPDCVPSGPEASGSR